MDFYQFDIAGWWPDTDYFLCPKFRFVVNVRHVWAWKLNTRFFTFKGHLYGANSVGKIFKDVNSDMHFE